MFYKIKIAIFVSQIVKIKCNNRPFHRRVRWLFTFTNLKSTHKPTTLAKHVSAVLIVSLKGNDRRHLLISTYMVATQVLPSITYIFMKFF